jgi:hypothetical protein
LKGKHSSGETQYEYERTFPFPSLPAPFFLGRLVRGTAEGFTVVRIFFAALVVASLFVRSGAEAQTNAKTVQGVFALAGAQPQTRATLTAVPAGPLNAELDLAFYARGDGGAQIRAYDTELSRKLHLIVVSDDLHATFAHLHPPLQTDGRFHAALAVPKPGLYHLYADAVPHGLNPQVFRFDVSFGTAPASPHPRDTNPTPRTVVAGPYVVALNSLLLDTGEETTIAAHISKDGKPAADLQPYLGAPAHAIFINERDLSYLHVHPLPADAPPGEMHDMQMPQTTVVEAAMTLRVRAPQNDTYKLWLQFQGGGQVYVAPFVLVAH